MPDHDSLINTAKYLAAFILVPLLMAIHVLFNPLTSEAACWECWGPGLPDPCRNTLYSVAMVPGSAGNDIWAVGSKGTILHWNGTAWSKVASPTTEILRSVAMARNNLGFAVGHNGWVIKWDGTTWTKSDAKTTNWFRTVGFAPGTNGNQAWAAADYAGVGFYMNWNGSQWDYYKVNKNNQMFGFTLWGLSMVDSSNGWAVGDALYQVSENQLEMKGQITRFNGTWAGTDYPVEKEGRLYGIKMLSNTDGWLVGENGIIARWNGTTWTQIAASPTANDLRSVDLRTASDGWAVGEEGTILRWNGTAWTSVASPVIYDLYGVLAVSATDAWAVGEFGTILRWDGTRWNTVFAPTAAKLEDISVVPGTNGSDIWAVGGSKLLRWNGSEWQSVQGPPASSYYAVGMVSQNDGWAPGPGSRFYRWNGSSWTLAGTWQSAWEILMLSANNGWAVGWSGKIQHWNGTDWSLVTSPTTTMLQAISAVGPNDIWSVGYNGTVVRYNGTAWSIVNTPDTGVLNDVSMASLTDGWAVGYALYANSQCQGPFLRWNGTSWTRPVYSQVSKTLYGVSLVQTPSGATGWAVGDEGALYQLKNGTWTAGCGYTANRLNGVAMASQYEAWAVGDGGVILNWVDPSRPATVPTVSTSTPSSITSSSASGGGNVTSDGKSAVTSRGICWATSPNPTKANTCAAGGSGNGAFTGNITGLSPGTTYNVRAYATNAVGTAYGSNKTFTTGLPNRVYVDAAGLCGGRAPCHNKVQNGVGAAGDGSTVLVMQGSYPESVGMNTGHPLIMDFGFNSDYSSCVSNSTIGDLTVSGGPVTIGGQLNIAGTTSSQGLAASDRDLKTNLAGTSKTPILAPARDNATLRPGSPEKTLFDLIMAGLITPHLEETTLQEKDREALEQMVRHFYASILERIPEQWVLDLWVDGYLGFYTSLGVDIVQTVSQMGRMIFLSGEYGGRNRNDLELLSDCSNAFMLDERSKETLSPASGLTREQAISLASSSYELAEWITSMLPGLRGEPVANMVSYLFAGLLGRLPWEEEIKRGQQTMQPNGYVMGSSLIGDALSSSDEFRQLFPSYPEQAERIYRTFCGRFVPMAELGLLRVELESGTLTLKDIISVLAEGDDFSSILYGFIAAD